MSTFDPLAPCDPWIEEDALCCDTAGLGEGVAARAIGAASSVLHALSGRRFGICTSTETISADRCGPPRRGRHATDYSPRQISLEASPVQSVTSVTEDGELLVLGTDYRVDDWRVLVRIGRSWRYPVEAVVVWGLPVPDEGALAAGELACEMVKACQGDSTCQLPPRAREVSRRGVTIPMLDPTDFLTAGRTGLPLCDLFLTAHNPHALTGRSRIYDPDSVGSHRHRGTAGATPAP